MIEAMSRRDILRQVLSNETDADRRKENIVEAMAIGIPLWILEQYLDLLDNAV